MRAGRKARGALEVAGLRDLKECHARVLLMLWTEATIVRTSELGFGCAVNRRAPRSLEAPTPFIPVGIRASERFENAVPRAVLDHDDAVVSADHLGFDEALAPGAQRLRDGESGFHRRGSGHDGSFLRSDEVDVRFPRSIISSGVNCRVSLISPPTPSCELRQLTATAHQ